MKKLLLIGAAALMAACSAQPETGYTVNVTATGDLTQLSNDTLVFVGGTRQTPVKDTVVLVNGKCTIKGETNTPTVYTLSFKGEKRAFARMFLENTNMSVTFDAATPAEAVVEGGQIQSMISQMEAKNKELKEVYKLDSLSKAYRNATDEEKEQIMAIFEKVENEVNAIEKAYMEANPVSPYGLYKLGQDISGMPYTELEAALAAYDTIPAYAENVMLKEYKEVAALVKSLQPGNQAPDFVQNDPNGKPVKFSDIYSKNKITMVDFWASWCGPCIRETATLKDIYKKWNGKGLDILGVAVWDKPEDTLEAIKQHNLPWNCIINGQEIPTNLYGILGIPCILVIDPEGTIVARNVYGDDLKAKINELLREKEDETKKK